MLLLIDFVRYNQSIKYLLVLSQLKSITFIERERERERERMMDIPKGIRYKLLYNFESIVCLIISKNENKKDN